MPPRTSSTSQYSRASGASFHHPSSICQGPEETRTSPLSSPSLRMAAICVSPSFVRVSTSTGTGGRNTRTASSPRLLRGLRRTSGGGGGSNAPMPYRSGMWPSTVIGMPTLPSPRMEISLAMVVASFSGESAAGPKRESCARRGRSGCATMEKATTGAPGGVFSRSRRRRASIVFASRVGAGGARGGEVHPVRLKGRRQLETRAGEALRLQPLGQPVERGAGDEEERLERHQRPLQLHPFPELGREGAGDERPRIDAPRGVMQLAPELAQAAGHFALGQAGQLADGAQAPLAERGRRIEGGGEAGQRRRRQKLRLAAFGDDDG